MALKIKLQTKIIGLVCIVVAVVLLVTSLLVSRSIAAQVKDSLGRQAMSVARMIARSPVIIEGLTGSRPAADIQKYANENKDLTNVAFIVVLDPDSTRLSHPNPALLGKHLMGGDEEAAMSGREYLSEATGTLGYSLRAFTPVYGPDGRQAGAVLVGILMNYVQEAVQQAQMIVLITMGIGMLLGILGAILLARDIKRTLFGLEPEVIAKQLEERSVMLQSVREAIIAVDAAGIITLVNEEGRRLLKLSGLSADPIGRPVNAFVPNTRLTEVLYTGKMELDQEQDLFGVSVLANRVPLLVNGNIVGAIATFRDKTEVKRLAEELTGVQDYVDALRSQAHEFMNQLHVILGMVQLENYDLLSSYICRIASESQAEVTFVGRRIRNPVLAGFILSKLSLAREKQIGMTLSETSFLPATQNENITHEAVTIIGNLVENAFDAVEGKAPCEVSLDISYKNGWVTIDVRDTGSGIAAGLEERIFEKEVSTKPGTHGYGLHLVKLSVDKLGGWIKTMRENGQTIFLVAFPYESAGEAG